MRYLLVGLLLVSCGRNGKNGTNGVDGKNGKDGENGHSLVSQINAASIIECSTGGQRLDIYLDMNDNFSTDEYDVYLNSLVACNGTNGEDGIAGEDGKDGADGVDGVNGADGSNGVDGRDGAIGLQGERGEQGPPGLEGKVGPQGLAGMEGPRGIDGIQGAVGERGEIGLRGLQGEQGAAGSNGVDGRDGSSGAIISSYVSANCTAVSGTSLFVKPNASNSAVYSTDNCSGSSKLYDIANGTSLFLDTNILAVKLTTGGIRVIKFN